MAEYYEQRARSYAGPMLGVVIVTASLYLAREVLIPLALALLFSALLAPAVRRLEALRLGRSASALISVGLFLALLAIVGIAAGNQVVSLAGKLPEYKENIEKKLRALHSPPKGDLGKAAKAIKEIQGDTAAAADKPVQKPTPKPAPPQLPTTPLEAIGVLGVPLLTLIGMAVAVLVLTTLMLLKKDDLRDRLIRLVGEGQIHLTTQAIEDAGGRVSRYLLMQLVVNVCYAVPLALALYFIGLPNALLFGLLATVLRFIPYVGAALAAAMPIALAFAISEGWQTIALTAGAIAILEFVTAYVVEPWLYGESTGLSPIAIVFSAIFWTWLWGPLGLLLATPLTVCVSVAGRHVPQFRFLYVILGGEPVLTPPVRFYQRLVAQELEEAQDVAEQFQNEHGFASLCECVLLPSLPLAQRDSERHALDEKRVRFVYEGLVQVAEELAPKAEREPDGPAICIAPARDEADFIAGTIFARLLRAEGFRARVLPGGQLISELVDRVVETGAEAVCVSSVPPSAATAAGYVCRRLRQRLSQQKIVVALWHAGGDLERARRRLHDAGADETVTRLPEALEKIRLVAPQRAG